MLIQDEELRSVVCRTLRCKEEELDEKKMLDLGSLTPLFNTDIHYSA